jgi:hypothetical protein
VSDVATVLHARLAGFAGLASLVAARIYPMQAPQGEALPYVVYEVPDTLSTPVLSGTSGANNVKPRVWCYGATYGSARAIAAQVKLALEAWRDQTTTPQIDGTTFVASGDGADQPADEQSSVRYWVRQDYSCWHS